jgi:hypothetical protein
MERNEIVTHTDANPPPHGQKMLKRCGDSVVAKIMAGVSAVACQKMSGFCKPSPVRITTEKHNSAVAC